MTGRGLLETIRWEKRCDALREALRADPDAALIAIRESKILSEWRMRGENRYSDHVEVREDPFSSAHGTVRRERSQVQNASELEAAPTGKVYWYANSGIYLDSNNQPEECKSIEEGKALVDAALKALGWTWEGQK